MNWAGDVLPTAGDTAVIGDTGSTAAIRIDQWTNVGEIRTSRDLQVAGGAAFTGTSFVGSAGATVRLAPGSPTASASIQLNGVTTSMDLDFGTGNVDVRVGDLTLQAATIRLGDAAGANTAYLVFSASQTLAGTGSVVFGGSPQNMILAESSLTIGPGITVRGNAGQIRSFGAVPIRNEGRIIADADTALPSDPTPISWTSRSNAPEFSATANPIDTSRIVDPLPMSVYQSSRRVSYDESSYDFEGLVPGAEHRVRLHFSDYGQDPSWASLWASLNGTNVLSDFRISSEAGGLDLAENSGATARADDAGRIRVTFSGNRYSFSAIEIFAGPRRVGYADAKGPYVGRISIDAPAFDNRGVIGTSGRGRLGLAGTWTNANGTVSMQGGTLDLGGSIDPATLGSWNRTGGQVNVTGTIENTGGTFRLDSGRGPWTLAGGTLRGGRLESAAGISLAVGSSLTGNSSVLDGVTIAGAIDILAGTYAEARILNGLVLDGGTIRLGDRAGTSRGTLSFTGTQTLAGTGTIVFGSDSGNSLLVLGSGQSGETFTIAPGITIRGSNGFIENPGWSPSKSVRIVNQGSIIADGSPPRETDAPYVTRQPNSWWYATSNPVDTSAVTNPLPQQVYRQMPGGYSSTMSIGLGGLTGGATYRVRMHFAEPDAPAGQRLMNVPVNRRQVLGTFDIAAEAGGICRAITREFEVVADAGGSIATVLTSVSGVPFVNAIEVFSGGTRVQYFDFFEPTPGTITIAANAFENRGSLVARGPGSLAISQARFNQIPSTSSWTNPSGTIVVDGGALSLGGRFSAADVGAKVRSGGTVTISGLLDNTGGTLALPAGTGEWRLFRGTIKGGRIEASTGNRLVVTPTHFYYYDYGTFDGVTLATDITVGAPRETAVDYAGHLVITNGLVMDGGRIILGQRFGPPEVGLTGGVLFFKGGTQSVSGTGEILFVHSGGITIGGDGAATRGSPSGVVTIGSGITIHGASGSIASDYNQPGRLVNEGAIVADAAPLPGDLPYDTGLYADPAFSIPFKSDGYAAIDTSAVIDPLPAAAYASAAQSWEPIGYVFRGLTAGAAYRLRLHFAETGYEQPGQRVMNVAVNGTEALAGFDVIGAAGGRFKAIVREVAATADSAGSVRVVFTATSGMSLVSAIEVMDGTRRVAGVDAGAGVSGIAVAVDSFENRGRLAVTDGSLRLGGSLRLADIAGLERSGGDVWLTGRLDLGGGVLDLDSTLGSPIVSGATLVNGRVQSTRGNKLVSGSNGVTLDAITLAANLDIHSTSYGEGPATVRNGLTLDGAVISVGGRVPSRYSWQQFPYSTLRFTGGSQTLGGSGAVVFGAGASNRIVLAGSGVANETFTIAPGVTIRGNAGTIAADPSNPITLVNQGTIMADASVPYPATEGYEVGFVVPTGGWSYAHVASSPTDVSGVADPLPEIAYRTYRTGTFDYGLDGLVPGGIHRLRLHFSGQSSIPQTVRVNGLEVLTAFNAAVAAGGANRAVVREVEAAADANGTITVSFIGYGLVSAIELFEGANRLRVIDAGTAVPGTLTVSPSALENRGTLGVANGETTSVSPASSGWTNAGTIDVRRGTLTVAGDYGQTAGETRLAGGVFDPTGAATITGGQLSGFGTIRANVTSSATVRPHAGTNAGTLTVDGTYRQTASGRLETRVFGPGVADGLAVSGAADISGALGVTVATGYAAAASGLAFPVITAASRTGEFATTTGLDQGGGRSFSVDYGATAVRLVSDVAAAAGPVVTAIPPEGVVNRSAVTLRVTFNETVDAASFTAADVAVTGPGGSAITGLIAVSAVSATVFDVALPSLADGRYAVAIGPNVTDTSGNPMPAAATAAVTIDTRGPRVVSAVPTDGISTPLKAFDVTFDGQIDPASFTAADVRLAGPGGAVVTVNSVQQISPTTYRVALSPPAQPGTYTLSLGPDIRDVAGNRLDQDQDGVGGETADDVFTTTAAVGRIDLVVSDVAMEPASPVSGGFVWVSYTVRNQGDSALVGGWTDGAYLRRVADDVGLTSTSQSTFTTLAAGGSVRISQAFWLPHGSLGTGRLQLTVTTDIYGAVPEWNAETNNAASITFVSSLASYPDLVVTGLRVVESSLAAGDTMTIRWSDRNQGAGPTTGGWYDLVRVVDNTTGRVLVNDDYVYSVPHDIAGGGSLARQYAFTLPSDFDPAAARLEVTVTADGWNYLAEYDAGGNLDGNNAATIPWASAPPAPDLTVSDLAVAESALAPGGPVTVRWNDLNGGTGGTGSGWTDRIVVRNLDTDTVLVDDTLSAASALAAGSSLAREFRFTLPTGSAGTGRISIQVTADSTGAVAESNAGGDAETNNSAMITRSSTVAADVDLVVTAVGTAEPYPVAGGPLTILSVQGPEAVPLPVLATVHRIVSGP
ncbi:MAG: CARDB domain-containing protein, partial [Planctomycetaceae bacterium]